MKLSAFILVLLMALAWGVGGCKKTTPDHIAPITPAPGDTMLALVESVIGTYLMHGTTYTYHLVDSGHVVTDTSFIYADTLTISACSDSSVSLTGAWGCGCGCWSYTPCSGTTYCFGGLVFYKNYPDSAMVSISAQTSWETGFSGSLSGRKIR